jgi:fumarate reductase flavoprotein subunit
LRKRQNFFEGENMKKFLIVALSLVMVLGMAACGTSAAPAATATPAVTATPAAEGIYTPGDYTATATGMGAVTVTITVDANSITNVVLDVSNETDSIGQAAADTLKQQILDTQSDAIDGVSGATITSTAVKTAVADCLAQAKA